MWRLRKSAIYLSESSSIGDVVLSCSETPHTPPAKGQMAEWGLGMRLGHLDFEGIPTLHIPTHIHTCTHAYALSLHSQELTAQQLEHEKKKISDTAVHLQQNLEVRVCY